MNGKKFVSIDELRADIERNYKGSEVGNIYDGKYRVASVGEGTPESMIERFRRAVTLKKTKLIYLIVEETDR